MTAPKPDTTTAERLPVSQLFRTCSAAIAARVTHTALHGQGWAERSPGHSACWQSVGFMLQKGDAVSSAPELPSTRDAGLEKMSWKALAFGAPLSWCPAVEGASLGMSAASCSSGAGAGAEAGGGSGDVHCSVCVGRAQVHSEARRRARAVALPRPTDCLPASARLRSASERVSLRSPAGAPPGIRTWQRAQVVGLAGKSLFLSPVPARAGLAEGAGGDSSVLYLFKVP